MAAVYILGSVGNDPGLQLLSSREHRNFYKVHFVCAHQVAFRQGPDLLSGLGKDDKYLHLGEYCIYPKAMLLSTSDKYIPRPSLLEFGFKYPPYDMVKPQVLVGKSNQRKVFIIYILLLIVK